MNVIDHLHVCVLIDVGRLGSARWCHYAIAALSCI